MTVCHPLYLAGLLLPALVLTVCALLWQASLLVGGPGTAKTTVINSFLSKFSSDSYSSKTITFSSLSTPAIFQVSVEVGAAIGCHACTAALSILCAGSCVERASPACITGACRLNARTGRNCTPSLCMQKRRQLLSTSLPALLPGITMLFSAFSSSSGLLALHVSMLVHSSGECGEAPGPHLWPSWRQGDDAVH